MNKLKLALSALSLSASSAVLAGGLLTNTNQSIAFLRNPARDAAIGIDGVYSNPAGVAFLPNGLHLSFNIQNAHQTRTITSMFSPFAFGAQNSGETKKFKGKADAPVIPSVQAAYNKGKWSFQFNFAVTGGGGKCVFENGLPSFEGTVGMLPLLSQNLDAVAEQLGLGNLGLEKVDSYAMDTYMRGRQYYYGFTLGAARQIDEHWSVYLGARLLYGSSNYYGYVSNIQAGIGGKLVNAPQTFSAASTQAAEAMGKYTELAQQATEANDLVNAAKYQAAAKLAGTQAVMYGALGEATQDVTLNCDQTGWGIAPIIGVDYKTGPLNFAAKYEFRTKMVLKNRAANSESAKNLQQLSRYEDGKKVREDSPALLAIGAQWSVLPQLRISAGWHRYFDKDSKQYNNHQKKLGGNTNEYLFGAEYDISKAIEVSAGMQRTQYDFTDAYMEDMSFNVSSYSFGFGVGVKLSKKVKLNVAYFQTLYDTYDRESNNFYNTSAIAEHIVGGVAGKLADANMAAAAQKLVNTMLTTPNAQTGKSMLYGKDLFTRANRVIGIGVDITI